MVQGNKEKYHNDLGIKIYRPEQFTTKSKYFLKFVNSEVLNKLTKFQAMYNNIAPLFLLATNSIIRRFFCMHPPSLVFVIFVFNESAPNILHIQWMVFSICSEFGLPTHVQQIEYIIIYCQIAAQKPVRLIDCSTSWGLIQPNVFSNDAFTTDIFRIALHQLQWKSWFIYYLRFLCTHAPIFQQ